ncbi:putative calcium proton exchanger protein [Eutypa lata UCREL1]|uniref:Vacuolar calcium ion transporter n=1 Tax=Eutypa lata (strain UCR-EL1) TaxID=1287681 RepID=M7SZP3_EUTLA|nr:putative calcium proton exchanger protein [Eutypa lata UCREL1]
MDSRHTHSTENGDAHERTSLLGSGSGGPNGDARHSYTRDFFLNSAYTPGTDSRKPWIRFPAHVWHILKAVLLSRWDPVATFVLNFLAIIPLAAVLSFATEEISVNLGEALGGLLNATFGNAVELIVSIIALNNGQFDVVKSSMIGSILSNILLVMGMCFFFGNIANLWRADGNGGMEQEFASGTAQTTASLMTLSAASMILPGTLKTHHNLFTVQQADSEPREDSEAGVSAEETLGQEHHEEEEIHMSPWSAAGVLIITTVLVSVCADYLVGSIDALVERAHISRNFIGLILIPIVGNAAEHVTAVVVAIKNKMDLAMGVAIGSSIQIALFVTPLLVILGWILGQPMDLHFETFETVAFALSVLIVIYTVTDGKSNYLEGAMLMALYVIIALAFFVTPSEEFEKERTLTGRLFGSS